MDSHLQKAVRERTMEWHLVNGISLSCICSRVFGVPEMRLFDKTFKYSIDICKYTVLKSINEYLNHVRENDYRKLYIKTFMNAIKCTNTFTVKLKPSHE